MSDSGGPADAVPRLAELQDRAVRGSLWTAAQSVAGVPLAFVANLLVARTLGPHGYGLVASYMAAFALILTVLNGGVSDATIQWGAAAYARGDRTELREIARRCSGYHLLVEGPLGALAAVVLLRHESAWVQIVGAISIALTLAVGTAVVMTTAISRTSVLAKQALLIGVATQVGVILAALQTHDAGAVWITRLAVATAAVVLPFLSLDADLRRAVLRPVLPVRWPTGFVRYSISTLAAGLVATLVFSRCEVLVLDAYGLVGQAGLFALAAGLAVQITAPIDAMLGPLVPAAASLVAADRGRAANAMERGIRLSVLGTIPLLALVVPVLAALVPLIYGEKFHEVGLLFVALGLVSCLQSALHPVTAFVVALRRPLTTLAFNGAALAVDLSLIALLGPLWGASAAVVANSAGQLVSLALSVDLVRRHLELSLRNVLWHLRGLILVAAIAAIATFCAEVLGGSPAVRAAIGLAATGTVSWLCLRLIGGVARRDDLTPVLAVLPRRLATAVTLLGRVGLVR